MAEAGTEHKWAGGAAHWQCLRCQASGFGKRKRSSCPGRSEHMCRVLVYPLGHSLRAGEVESGAVVLRCTLCGAWGTGRTTRDLSQSLPQSADKGTKRIQCKGKQGMSPMA